MKNMFPAVATRSFIFTQTDRTKIHLFGVLILLASCTNAQVRWDATRMRKDVMVYYNDQIMENLIKAKNNLPFVHVDIDLLTSQGATQITGAVGYGETITNTGTNALTNQTTTTDVTSTSPTGPGSMHTVATIAGGIVATASHIAMRPFSYSVTPQRSETLSISSKPALGSQALASPSPAPSSSQKPEYEVTKKIKTTGPSGEQETEEQTLKTPTSKAITIYELYEHFAEKDVSHSPTEPPPGSYLPGTLEKWKRVPGTPQKYNIEYYYISVADAKKYYEFCKQLFTKGQTGSLESELATTRAQVESIKAQLATPLPPP